MSVKLTNLTGLNLHYRILDFEGPFANFGEQLLPGQYPTGQADYTTSDSYYSGDNTRVGDQRYTLSSRYPKFNSSTEYLPGNYSQRPSHRSYKELMHQYPPQRLHSSVYTSSGKRVNSVRMLDGNREGIIPKGLQRDIMLKDINCNIELTTMGEPSVTKVVDPSNYVQTNGRTTTSVDTVIDHSDPRYAKYKAIVKVARLRETNVLACIARDKTFYMYDSFGVRIQLDFTYDATIMPMYELAPVSMMDKIKSRFSKSSTRITGSRNMPEPRVYPDGVVNEYTNFAPSVSAGYGDNAEPSMTGTYIDSLRGNYSSRKRNYGKKYVDMTAPNYSEDYDKPILGYFDRRWLNYQ